MIDINRYIHVCRRTHWNNKNAIIKILWYIGCLHVHWIKCEHCGVILLSCTSSVYVSLDFPNARRYSFCKNVIVCYWLITRWKIFCLGGGASSVVLIAEAPFTFTSGVPYHCIQFTLWVRPKKLLSRSDVTRDSITTSISNYRSDYVKLLNCVKCHVSGQFMINMWFLYTATL